MRRRRAPYGAVQFQSFHAPAYGESQSDLTRRFGLSFNATNVTDVRTELGSRFDAPTLVCGKPLVFYGRVALAHDFVDNPALSAGFQTLPGTNFTVLWCANPPRLGADHGRSETVPCRQLVIDRQVRRRVRFRLRRPTPVRERCATPGERRVVGSARLGRLLTHALMGQAMRRNFRPRFVGYE